MGCQGLKLASCDGEGVCIFLNGLIKTRNSFLFIILTFNILLSICPEGLNKFDSSWDSPPKLPKKKKTWRIELRGLNPISFFIMNLLIAFHSCTEMKYFKYLLFYCRPPISRSEIFPSRANHYNSIAARWMGSKDIYGDTGGWIIIKDSIWFDWLIYLLTNWLIDWLIGLIIISILLYFLSFCFSFNSSECLLTFYSFLIFIIIL